MAKTCSNPACTYSNPTRTTAANNLACNGKINGVKCTGTYTVTVDEANLTVQRRTAIRLKRSRKLFLLNFQKTRLIHPGQDKYYTYNYL